MDISKQNLILIGFLIIAVTTGWLTFKQSRVVDAMGDVASLKADISDEKLKLAEFLKDKTAESKKDKPDADEIKDIEEDIKEQEEEITKLTDKLPAQIQDVADAKASLPNGAIFWVILIQVGAAAFGVGLIKLLQNDDESERLRSSALIILGALVIFLLLGKVTYLISSSTGAAF